MYTASAWRVDDTTPYIKHIMYVSMKMLLCCLGVTYELSCYRYSVSHHTPPYTACTALVCRFGMRANLSKIPDKNKCQMKWKCGSVPISRSLACALLLFCILTGNALYRNAVACSGGFRQPEHYRSCTILDKFSYIGDSYGRWIKYKFKKEDQNPTDTETRTRAASNRINTVSITTCFNCL